MKKNVLSLSLIYLIKFLGVMSGDIDARAPQLERSVFSRILIPGGAQKCLHHGLHYFCFFYNPDRLNMNI